MTEELSITYFRNLLGKNQTELKGFCKDWKKINNDSDVPEAVCDEIRTTIGLTNLLLEQKLKQFAGLIDDSELKRGEKEITCLDLQGFWDMVYNEVEKIQNRFKNLRICQQNNWIFVEEPVTIKEPKKKLAMTSIAKVTTETKARALAARQRLAEAKLKMKAQMIKKSGNSEVDPKIQEVSESKVSAGSQSSPKRTLKNIRNLHISEEEGDLSIKSEIPPKKMSLAEINKGLTKKQKSLKTEKENINCTEECIVPNIQKKKN